MSNEFGDKKEKASAKNDDAVPKGDAAQKDKSENEKAGKTENAKNAGVKGDAVKPADEQPVKDGKVSEKSVSSKEVAKADDVPKPPSVKGDVGKKESAKPEVVKAHTESKQIGKNEDAASVVQNEVSKNQPKKAEAKENSPVPTEPAHADSSVKDAAKTAESSKSSDNVAKKNESQKNGTTGEVQKTEVTKNGNVNKTADGKVHKTEVAKDDAAKKAVDGEVQKSEHTKIEAADKAVDGKDRKSEVAKNDANNAVNADAKKKVDRKDIVRDASVTTTISPGNRTTENVSIDSVPGSRTIAENIFPEKMHVKNLSGLFEPTLPPSKYNQDTYAAIEAAAEDFDYESRQDVISSVQNILKPKGEFLSRAELLQASKQLRKVMPYNLEAWRLHADILLNALRQLETRQIMPDESFQILAIPLRENDIRDAAEAALRQCAHFAGSEERRIRFIDEANSVRRLTWF